MERSAPFSFVSPNNIGSIFMDTVSQNMFKAFVVQPQMSCEHICNEMQNLMDSYKKLNGNLDNVILTIRLVRTVDASSQESSVPLIEYHPEH